VVIAVEPITLALHIRLFIMPLEERSTDKIGQMTMSKPECVKSDVGTRLGCSSIETRETSALLGHGIVTGFFSIRYAST